jgi:hypothetical protein
VLAGHRRQVFPDRDRAREGDKPHHGLRDQIFGDFRVRYRIPGSRRQPASRHRQRRPIARHPPVFLPRPSG